MKTRSFCASAFTVILALAACSGSSDAPSVALDAGLDSRDNGPSDATPATGVGLFGTVKDKAGMVVQGAKIEMGSDSALSDAQGKYELKLATSGDMALKVTRSWFKPLTAMVVVAATSTTPHDIVIEEMPLTLDPGDLALAEGYAKTFDWSRQTLSITIAAKATRRDFDNAVYFRNPALYRDTSKEAPVTPSPVPALVGGKPMNFSFVLRSGTNQGVDALDIASIVDSLEDTGLAPADRNGFFTWNPMVTWLGDWDMGKAADLNATGVAVRQQNWGANAPRPQEIERAFIDSVSGTLWVEIVFGTFVQTGAGITDNDGDGRKEIYAKIASVHYRKDLVAQLMGDYRSRQFGTHALSREVSKSLNALYSTTAAQVERLIGDPFEVPGVGTIKYPFVVLRHSGGQKNVILVAP